MCLCVGKSTDEELLDLMLELAQTPVGTATQQTPSQSLYQSQSVASFLCSRLSRPPSSSSLSLSRPFKPGDTSLPRSQPVSNTSMTGSKPSSQPVLRTGSDSKPDPLSWKTRCEEEVAETSWSDADRFLVAVEGQNWFANPSGQSTSEAVGEPPTGTKPVQPVYQPVERGSPPHSEPPLHSASKSPVPSDADLFDTDFSSSSPLFLSPPPPPHRDIIALADSEERLAHGDDIDPSVMLNSSSVAIGNKDRSGSEIGETPEVTSEYDLIPCAQPTSSSHRSSPSPNGARTSAPLQDALKTGNHDDDGEFVPKGMASVDVQLEYKLPEILSHFESFQSTATEILGTPNKMAGTERTTPQKKVDDVLLEGVKDRNDGVKNEKEVTIERVKESPFDSSSSLVISEGSDPLLESSFVVPGNTLAAALSSESSPKESSTPFRTEAGIEREWVGHTSEGGEGEGVGHTSEGREREGEEEMSFSEGRGSRRRSRREGEGEEKGTSICLSSSQRRAILRQLTCAMGDGGDMSDVEEGGSEQEEEEEDKEEEWLSGEWSTQPLTIPERYI